MNTNTQTTIVMDFDTLLRISARYCGHVPLTAVCLTRDAHDMVIRIETTDDDPILNPEWGCIFDATLYDYTLIQIEQARSQVVATLEQGWVVNTLQEVAKMYDACHDPLELLDFDYPRLGMLAHVAIGKHDDWFIKAVKRETTD